jgi:tetratricopeptide (TPR) repeat protein
LTWISLQADATLFGSRAWGYHLTNLLLHTAAVLVLYAALRHMTSERGRSAAVAALFAVHPLHVESVAWVAERKDVLGGLLWMLTLAAYARYARQPGVGRYALVVLLTALGLMAKPMLVTLPCVLLLLDYWPLRRSPVEGVAPPGPEAPSFAPAGAARLVLEKVPLLALAAACSAATVGAQERIIQNDLDFPWPARAANALVTAVNYLAQMVWPRDLAFFYPHPEGALPAWKVGGAALFLAGVSLLAAWTARRRPYLVVGWLWYLGTLVPVIGLIQVGLQGHADRYTYIPLIGIFLLLAWGVPPLLAHLGVSPSVTAAGTVVLIGGSAVAAWDQAGAWADSPTLWQHTLDATGDNFMAHFHLGNHLLKQGDVGGARRHFLASLRLKPGIAATHAGLAKTHVREGRLDDGIASYEEALRINPRLAPVHHDLANLYARKGELVAAVRHFREALELQPGQAETHNNLGAACTRLGNLDEAVAEYRAALALRPENIGTRLNLCLALTRLGKLDEAAGECEEAVGRLGPGESSYPEAVHQLGLVRQRQGRWDDAVAAFRLAVGAAPRTIRFRCSLAHGLSARGDKAEAARQYEEALRIDPRWPEQANREARLLATDPEAAHRDGPTAVELAQQACEATGSDHPEYLDTLAAALAEVGRFPEAVAAARRALERAAAVHPELVPAIRARLGRFQERQPWREAAGPGR